LWNQRWEFDKVPATMLAALYALADDEQNRRSIAEGGGIDPLMDLLHSPDQVMRKHAEGTLARLSLVDSNQMLIIKQLVRMP
jgi:hypothetical protein